MAIIAFKKKKPWKKISHQSLEILNRILTQKFPVGSESQSFLQIAEENQGINDKFLEKFFGFEDYFLKFARISFFIYKDSKVNRNFSIKIATIPSTNKEHNSILFFVDSFDGEYSNGFDWREFFNGIQSEIEERVEKELKVNKVLFAFADDVKE